MPNDYQYVTVKLFLIQECRRLSHLLTLQVACLKGTEMMRKMTITSHLLHCTLFFACHASWLVGVSSCVTTFGHTMRNTTYVNCGTGGVSGWEQNRENKNMLPFTPKLQVYFVPHLKFGWNPIVWRFNESYLFFNIVQN